MENYEVTLERKTTYVVKVTANNEMHASQKVLEMDTNQLNLWASDEDVEITDIFEITP